MHWISNDRFHISKKSIVKSSFGSGSILLLPMCSNQQLKRAEHALWFDICFARDITHYYCLQLLQRNLRVEVSAAHTSNMYHVLVFAWSCAVYTLHLRWGAPKNRARRVMSTCTDCSWPKFHESAVIRHEREQNDTFRVCVCVYVCGGERVTSSK